MSSNFFMGFRIYIIDLNAKQFSKKAHSFKNLKNNNKIKFNCFKYLSGLYWFYIIKLIHKKSHY